MTLRGLPALAADARRASAATGDLLAALRVDGDLQQARRAPHDEVEPGGAVEVEAVHDAETAAQGRREQQQRRDRNDIREKQDMDEPGAWRQH